MSNIRPISDPAIATAMLATMQSIDSSRSAPSGISQPRWRILQCIAKAAPNVPTSRELILCSGLNKAALAEHVQALQWKGLLEMGGYRLSPSAAAMVGIAPLPANAVKGAKFAAPMDPADDPACLRPDCTPPAHPVEEVRHELLARKSDQGREDDRPVECHAHSRGQSDRAAGEDVEARRVSRTAEVSRIDRPQRRAIADAETVQPADRVNASPPKVSSPPATPPKFTNWIEERRERLEAAIQFLKSKAILVSVVDRDAQVRQYFVTGKRSRLFAEEVIEIAIDKGWVE